MARARSGGLVVNDGLLCITWAEQGLGLAYVMEPLVEQQLRTGSLRRVLEPYAAPVPGFFLYYPSRAQRSAALRLFVETVRELTAKSRGAKTRQQPGVGLRRCHRTTPRTAPTLR